VLASTLDHQTIVHPHSLRATADKRTCVRTQFGVSGSSPGGTLAG
jgi:hypothetical protein